MATATRRGQFWSARWRDATGRWREKRTHCRTKTEALVLARDLEHQADLQRLGLEPLPERRAAMSFEDLFSWWWKEYGRRRRSPDIDKVARKHLLPTLGGLPLSEVTPARLEGSRRQGRRARREVAEPPSRPRPHRVCSRDQAGSLDRHEPGRPRRAQEGSEASARVPPARGGGAPPRASGRALAPALRG